MASPTNPAYCALFLAICLLAPCRLLAQNQPTATNSNVILSKALSFPKEEMQFSEALAEIVKQTEVILYADDRPKMGKIKLSKHCSFEEAVVALAEQCDFYWSFQKPSSLTLIRRWKDPLDFPTINPAELEMSADNVLSLIPQQGFPEGPKGDFDYPSSMSLFESSLRDQKARLNDGGALGWNDYSCNPTQTFHCRDAGHDTPQIHRCLENYQASYFNASAMQAPADKIQIPANRSGYGDC